MMRFYPVTCLDNGKLKPNYFSIVITQTICIFAKLD